MSKELLEAIRIVAEGTQEEATFLEDLQYIDERIEGLMILKAEIQAEINELTDVELDILDDLEERDSNSPARVASRQRRQAKQDDDQFDNDRHTPRAQLQKADPIKSKVSRGKLTPDQIKKRRDDAKSRKSPEGIKGGGGDSRDAGIARKKQRDASSAKDKKIDRLSSASRTARSGDRSRNSDQEKSFRKSDVESRRTFNKKSADRQKAKFRQGAG